MDIEQLKQQSLTSTYLPHHAILLSNGETLLSYSHLDAGTAKLEVIKIAVDGTLSSVLVDSVDNSSLLSNERFSSLCEMGDGSILLATWDVDNIDEVANIMIFRSIDEGDSWTLVSSKALPEETIQSLLNLVYLALLTNIVSCLLLSVSGVNVLSSIAATAACMFNIGPGFDHVGPVSHYGTLPAMAKWVLSGCMLAGRLEFYTVLVIFTRAFWRR